MPPVQARLHGLPDREQTQSPLDHALAQAGTRDRTDRRQLIQVLLEHDADVNSQTNPGVSSFNHWALRTRGEAPYIAPLPGRGTKAINRRKRSQQRRNDLVLRCLCIFLFHPLVLLVIISETDRELAIDAMPKGKPLSEGLQAYDAPPLHAVFLVSNPDQRR